MSFKSRAIPFEVEISRVIELLANQIYQSPLALLRENTQNAFDAVLMRRSIDNAFDPRIDVHLTPTSVTVADNGVGMTPAELETNYWRAGSSGKNTPEARAAGVVGTFGIGAMANFGVATSLQVETESSKDRVRTRSLVDRDQLSTTEDCITLEPLSPTGSPGTVVTAWLPADSQLNMDEARHYLVQFVEFVNIPVYLNDTLISGRDPREVLPSERFSWEERRARVKLADLAVADVEVRGLASGELRVLLDEVETLPPTGRRGRAILVQGGGAVRTLRSGFGLATISVPSLYRFGGVLDLAALKPTAGREALESGSNDLLQRLMRALDEIVSELAAPHEEVFENQDFLRWIQRGQRFELCGPLVVQVEPGPVERRMEDLARNGPVRYYAGMDKGIIQAYASEERPLVVLSRRSPRRDCELGFLRSNGGEEVSDEPQVLKEFDGTDLAVEFGAVAFRIARVLAEDYFIEADVRFATMTHGIPVLVERGAKPIVLWLDPGSDALMPIAELYRTDFLAFGPLVKDFVRAHVFPKVSDLVPSSTREGAQAFLRRLRGKRDLFEIDWTDREELESIWRKYANGEINLTEATLRSRTTPRRSVVVVRQDQSASIETVVPALEESTSTNMDDEYGPLPPIDRRDTSTDALVLSGQEFNGYSCYLALSERAQRESGEFFFQPHATSIVWGGQKILFVFQHHSGRLALYYDVQCPGLVAETSGGGPHRTSTLLLKDRVFIPIPAQLAHNVIPPPGERIRLDVRSDVLPLDMS